MIELFAFQPQTDRCSDQARAFLDVHVSVTGQIKRRSNTAYTQLSLTETSLLSAPEIVGRTWPTSARQMISLGLLHRARA